MDLLRRKRRRDEAATGIDEASPMARVYGKHGIIRRMSQNTQIEAEDYDVHDSCVLRNFPKQKSSDLRFLAWVAYTRKFSDSSMTDVERRTCPLIWCRDVFPSEDAMLKHVYTCEHLSKGLYWCFRCQKTERVGKFQCKRCQGTPTTAERITTVAKKIFTGLGVRRAVGDHFDPTICRKVTSPKEPRSPNCSPLPEKGAQLQEMVEDSEERNHLELPNTTISEMEAENIFELSAGWTTQSQELPDSSLAEMTGSEFAPISPLVYPDEKSSHDLFNLSMCNATLASTYGTSPRRPSQPISLRLDTGMTEPLQQHCPRPDSSATVLSPLSPSDRIRSGFFTVSPTDTAVSSQSMFSNSECSSATTLSAWDESSNSLGWGRDISEVKSYAASLGRFSSNASDKLSRNGSILSNTSQILPDILPLTLERHASSSSTSSAAHLANRCTISEKRQSLSAYWPSEKDLVKSLSEVLQEHIEHSRQALRKLPPNSNTLELLALSTSSIRSIGFEVLERLLEGRNPSSLVHIFAFTNVAYSMAVAVDRNASKVQTEQWFQHCVFWSTLLSSERDRRRYEQIAHAIWKPHAATNSQPSSCLLNTMERENKLIAACKHFLDLLQCLGNHEKSNPATRGQFNFARSSFVHKAKMSVIDQLIQKPSIEAFIEDVVNVESLLNNNFISDVRQLELELICTAKLASQSDTAYARFTNHVTDLCDAMYVESYIKSRTTYHLETIALAYQLLPVVEYTNNEYEMPQYNVDFQISGHDFALEGIETPAESFSKDVDAILNESFDFSQFEFASPTTLLESSSSIQQTAISLDVPTILVSSSANSADSHSPSSTATKYRCHCGYVPTGEERWKGSNLSRHKRIQHPENGSKVYKCEWEGCGSTFTRSDNLKEHVRKKGHHVWRVEGEKETSQGESTRKRRKKEMKDEMDTALR